ncbi:helix-turn-helix transcriptional regulator [Oscillochloris sp. ZM17-4]|uniref:helix-turn-helix domain-containing protein n=1 Tax=Oscillochloris sp. ZM17-4 TaxID=2866714 RepID=UPI001C735B7D|nr:helix-turn-helix transcriptional regulator [Oscillochloris sp. ZM17-4]MBX0331183.1 helix-turn-helix transcriptional regulator [Oscillochloris sp. ZM17-4]
MPPYPDDPLTLREHQVMELVARGENDAQIALQLGVAPQTVTHYVGSVCQKIGAPNRVVAAVWYALS